ncbi:hypothetical protein PIROE2DRAFT_2477 [Piromyces sp. E2]|nr:hypothetical protein PIROE2DRAFT_2477 [Piromyces sp. E2]|eukprot:OUM69609.1 hypothetical protein PIROE2DRAFT_2477 [Piromyces sp. E2]
MDDIDLTIFPDDWDIDNINHFNYYKKCSPYANNSEYFDNVINKNKQKSETKATQNGMLKMLEDNVLLREFSEFCRKENCTENILFYQKYWKYRRLFDNPEKNNRIIKSNFYINNNTSTMLPSTYDFEEHDHTASIISFEVPLDTSVSIIEDNCNVSMINGIEHIHSEIDNPKRFGNGRKITKNEILIKEANNILEDFILNDGKFEVNISDKVKRSIIFNFKDIKNNEFQQQDFKNKLKCLFDDAYTEVINSLFLNSYTNYISIKRNIYNIYL